MPTDDTRMPLRLYDAWLDFRRDSRVAHCRHAYGSLQAMGPQAGPLIHWQPTRDRKAPPIQSQVEDVQSGDKVEVYSPLSLWKGARISIYLQGPGEQAHPALEDLLHRVLLALWSSLNTDENVQIDDGALIDDPEVSAGGLLYQLAVRVRVPVLDLATMAEILTVEAPDLPASDA